MGSIPPELVEYTDDREDSDPNLARRRRRRKRPAKMIMSPAIKVPVAIPPIADEEIPFEGELVGVGVVVLASTLSLIVFPAYPRLRQEGTHRQLWNLRDSE